MTTVDKHNSPVYRQLEAYGESWKKRHAEAMACRDWEDAIAVGINIFHMLREREQAWRDQVFRGIVPFALEDNQDHQGRFRNWLATTRDVLADSLPQLESRFGTVEGAAKLRECAALAENVISAWAPPRLSMSVGLRDMTLSPEAANRLDEMLEATKENPPPRIESPLQVKDRSFLKRPASGKANS
ncbi:MAG TPA: hypothetical protein VE988_20015 [Gemmataceae bacterium]|nr:hypothetical protein [Gemmataceae bacterium]